MNSFNFVGRLVRDPEDKSQKKGKKGYSMSRFTVALDAYRNNEKTADFITCIAWGGIADFMNEFPVKGSRVALSGHVQSGKYEDETGSTFYTTDFVVDKAELLDSKEETEALIEENKKKIKKKIKKGKKPIKRPAREPADEEEDMELPWDEEDE